MASFSAAVEKLQISTPSGQEDDHQWAGGQNEKESDQLKNDFKIHMFLPGLKNGEPVFLAILLARQPKNPAKGRSSHDRPGRHSLRGTQDR